MAQSETAVTPSFISTQVLGAKYYFLDLTPDDKQDMVVVCGGREDCAPNYAIDRPGFQYFSIECVFAGHGDLTLDGRTFEIGPGSTFHYGPDIAHQIRNRSSQPLIKYFVSFLGRRAVDLLNASPMQKLEPVRVADPLRLYEIFEQLQYSGNTGTDHSRRICAVLLELLILRITEQSISLRKTDSQAWQTYQQCRRFMEENFLTVHSVEEAAGRCRVDPAYLCRLFQRFSQQTPYQLLVRLKMGRAAELLVHSDLLIKQVAQAIGLSDPYHFSKVFKKIHGVSPNGFVKRAHRHTRSLTRIRK
jgi:AraC-like DNA-binding protein